MSKIQRMTEEEKLKTSAIIELYTAVQSEGSRAGIPTIVVRTTGCTHRCWFGDGGWCDSFYTSIHPEKAKY
jgi:7-carboxy-7-deazaguanine synthase